jgi:hypothetical protein
MSRRFPTLSVVLCAALLGVAGCSGDGTAATTTSAATTTTAPSTTMTTTSVVDTTAPTTTTSRTAATTLPPTTTTSGLPPLTDAYGGGVGFWLGAADQTARLSVAWYGPWPDFESGPLPMVIVLPDEEWRAVLAFGHNLFASWGYGDLRDRVVDERWPVVAGTITILELPPEGECGEARGRLEGLEDEAPDGTLVDLGDFEVENRQWGCFML